MRILLTGATGFVGGQLLPKLLTAGHQIRCLVRSQKSTDKVSSDLVEAVIGDALEKPSLVAAIQDCDAAYYMIHSMGSGGDFEEQDRKCAQNFADAANECDVNRIIYVSGLANESDADLSSYWLALVTPETAAVGMQMIDGLRNPTIVRSPLSKQLFDIEPMTIGEAIKVAIEKRPSEKAND